VNHSCNSRILAPLDGLHYFTDGKKADLRKYQAR
jgi:hypothetical protein